MKTTPFTFHFKGGEITVRAFNATEARILAQAEAIKRGWDYEIQEKSACEDELYADLLAEQQEQM